MEKTIQSGMQDSHHTTQHTTVRGQFSPLRGGLVLFQSIGTQNILYGVVWHCLACITVEQSIVPFRFGEISIMVIVKSYETSTDKYQNKFYYSLPLKQISHKSTV